MTQPHDDQNKSNGGDKNHNTDPTPSQSLATDKQALSDTPETAAQAHTEQTAPAAGTSPQPSTADSSTTRSDQSTQADTQSKQKKAKLKLFILLLLICILGFIAYGLWKAYQPKAIEIQGRVEAETIHISTKVPSRIDEIYVHEGQKVKKGQLLVRLHSPEVETKKQQALGLLQSALALQSSTDRGAQQENIETFYANWQSLKAQAQLAATTYQRGAHLYKEGVISRQRRDEMQAAAVSSQQLAEASYQQYARLKRGSTVEEKSTADAQVDIARAAVAEANSLETETVLLAPVDGTVSKIYGNVSELVAMAVPVVSLIDDAEIKVSVNVREDQYASVYQAKTLDGYIPALQKNMAFKITHIDAEGDFATIKTTRQTGGYDIRSFKLNLAPVQAIPELKVGMSVLFKVPETK